MIIPFLQNTHSRWQLYYTPEERALQKGYNSLFFYFDPPDGTILDTGIPHNPAASWHASRPTHHLLGADGGQIGIGSSSGTIAPNRFLIVRSSLCICQHLNGNTKLHTQPSCPPPYQLDLARFQKPTLEKQPYIHHFQSLFFESSHDIVTSEKIN